MAPYVNNDESWQIPPAHQTKPVFDYTAANHKAHHDVSHFEREGGHEYVVWKRSGGVPAMLSASDVVDNISRTKNLNNPDHVRMADLDTSAAESSPSMGTMTNTNPSPSNTDAAAARAPKDSTAPGTSKVAALENAGIAVLWEKYCNQRYMTASELEILNNSEPPEFLYETCTGLK